MNNEVVEVSTSQISEHSLQSEFSPDMSKRKWRDFLVSVTKEGILQPLIVTKGFRVIDGKHRLRAAKELGIESVRVIIDDIPEDKIPSYITNTKLQRDDLKRGQKAALVIRLFYEEERQKAKASYRDNVGRPKESFPGLETNKQHVHVELAKKAGIGKSSMANLLAVYRNRADLFEQVFNGTISINKAYTQMKADEEPEQVDEESPLETERQVVEYLRKQEERLPQIDESKPLNSLDNRLIQMRKNLLSTAVEVLDESDKLNETTKEIKESVLHQAAAMAKACTLLLGQNSKSSKKAETLALIYELFNQIEEED